MRLPALALAAVLAAGCAASSGGSTTDSAAQPPAAASPAAPKKDTHGCATAHAGLIPYADLRQGAQDQTITPDDMSKLLAKIADKMNAVATISVPDLADHAKAAAVAAGHMRVALAGQGDFDVKAENETLGTELDAVAAYCA